MTQPLLLLACQVVFKEMERGLPPDLPRRVLDPALHLQPDLLRKTLQEAVNQEEDKYDSIILGYGLCSRAVEGLKSSRARLILPRVDDCIGIFLGSRQAHLSALAAEPGTFFLSRGWIEAGVTPFNEFEYTVKRFGREKAYSLTQRMLRHYRRLALLSLGRDEKYCRYLDYAREMATKFGLDLQEMEGSGRLMEKMTRGPWDDDFLIVPAGREITFEMFFGRD
ncbi:MAG: DUF1638 domain-containing protein [Pseudomonadota bacterium]